MLAQHSHVKECVRDITTEPSEEAAFLQVRAPPCSMSCLTFNQLRSLHWAPSGHMAESRRRFPTYAELLLEYESTQQLPGIGLIWCTYSITVAMV